MPRSFFLSYSSDDIHPYLEEFYEYLNMRVRNLTGLRMGGYLAKFDMQTGHEWKPDLLDALQEAQIFGARQE